MKVSLIEHIILNDYIILQIYVFLYYKFQVLWIPLCSQSSFLDEYFCEDEFIFGIFFELFSQQLHNFTNLINIFISFIFIKKLKI